MELAIQYTKENPNPDYVPNCPVYTISCTIAIDNPTQDKQLTDTKTITVYWDLSYGPVYVCKSNIADPASEHLCKNYMVWVEHVPQTQNILKVILIHLKK